MFKILLFVSTFVSAYSANILYVSTIPSPSHHIWNSAFAQELARKGNNVTVIGPDKNHIKLANYTHILLDGLYEMFAKNVNVLSLSDFKPSLFLWRFIDLNVGFCKTYLESQGLQTLLNYPEDFKFDLIIFDVSVGSCLYSLIQRFNYPPSIGVVPFLLPVHVAYNFGSHLQPAYVPWLLPYSNHMTFFERVWNFVFSYADVALRNLKQYGAEYEEAKKVFGENLRPMPELERHVSLILANIDPILHYPQPLPPNIVPVGGLHIEKNKKLPQDLEAILNKAQNGVIVFSLGTNVRSDKIDKKAQGAFIDAFRNLSETVIWKFESEISDLPKNVIVRRWLSQSDLLAHPKVKAFIGHGGALSTQEAVFHEKPMLCVPFHLDQTQNCMSVINRNMGVFLDYKIITAEYVIKKLREILDNPMYTENIQKASHRFKTQKEMPMERAIFWTNYVIQHGGTEFLSTVARDLPFYKSTGLDVIGFLSLIFTLVLAIILKCVKLVRKPCSNKKVKIN